MHEWMINWNGNYTMTQNFSGLNTRQQTNLNHNEILERKCLSAIRRTEDWIIYHGCLFWWRLQFWAAGKPFLCHLNTHFYATERRPQPCFHFLLLTKSRYVLFPSSHRLHRNQRDVARDLRTKNSTRGRSVTSAAVPAIHSSVLSQSHELWKIQSQCPIKK